jgi:heme oxygenase (biliverdin-IX-beta and delta-forming)
MRHPLLQQLKQKTFSQHERLEQYLQLLRPTVTLQDYRALLEGFYGFYLPWEGRAASLLHRELPGFFEGRRKTPLLERDLHVLQSNLSAIPRCPSLPKTDSLLALLGSLYVLEGATLGGQILTRHFAQQLNLSPERGCSFFYSYGPAVGHQWRTFCDLLASHSSPDNNQLIVRSAVETFSCFGHWLRPEADCPTT